MGGKTLRFPKRKKYVAEQAKPEETGKDEAVSEEEHQKRIELLKQLGLVKDSQGSN